MPTCPAGHASSTTDYCDECGVPMAADPPPAREDTDRSHRTELLASSRTGPDREPCPVCSAPRSGDDRFCERCGFDFTGPGPSTVAWVAEVEADRSLYERVAPAEVAFPDGRSPQVFPLGADEVSIGRRSESRGVHPDIDLSGPLADPGVSHRHAILERRDDGSYQLVDAGSTNGTTINGGVTPLEVGMPLALSDGDRIHVGAWTTITIHH